MDDNQPIPNVDDFANPLASAAFKFFCRHLVTLDGHWQPLDNNKPNGPMKPFSYPGVVLSVHAKWFFVTAGHTLRKIDEYMALPEARILEWCLRDHFGPEPTNKHPIPINYNDSPHFAVHDAAEGLDFGVLVLNPNQQALLAANNIAPISEENWAHQHEIERDRHIMLGLPDKYVEFTCVSPTMLGVTQLHDLPDGVPPTNYPRFVGKLDDRVDFDIEGMSGGPIYGFKKGCDNRYWIVAIQSSWLRHRKLVFACPIPILAQIVQIGYEAAFHGLADEESST